MLGQTYTVIARICRNASIPNNQIAGHKGGLRNGLKDTITINIGNRKTLIEDLIYSIVHGNAESNHNFIGRISLGIWVSRQNSIVRPDRALPLDTGRDSRRVISTERIWHHA